MPRGENVKTDDRRRKKERIALNNHQHGLTTNLKRTEVNKYSIFPGIMVGSKFVARCDIIKGKWNIFSKIASS